MLSVDALELINNTIKAYDGSIKIPTDRIQELPLGTWLEAELVLGELSLGEILYPITRILTPLLPKEHQKQLMETFTTIVKYPPKTLQDIVKLKDEKVVVLMAVVSLWYQFSNKYMDRDTWEATIKVNARSMAETLYQTLKYNISKEEQYVKTWEHSTGTSVEDVQELGERTSDTAGSVQTDTRS